MNTYVYVDGFNLYYGCVKGTPYYWLNLEALCAHVLPQHDVRKIRYFTARVSGRPGDPSCHQRQDTYLRALRTLPSVEIHLGHFLTTRARMPLADPPPNGPRTAEVIRTEEKGSDVNLATHLLVDGFRRSFDVAVVISNDSDLAEPLRILREEFGLRIGLVNPHSAENRSRRLLETRPLFFKQIRQTALANSQFPEEFKDEAGRTIRKPREWM